MRKYFLNFFIFYFLFFGASSLFAIEKEDEKLARLSLERETIINRLKYKFSNNHINRLNQGACDVISGFVFLDILTNFEKIGDHSYNIGEAVLGIK